MLLLLRLVLTALAFGISSRPSGNIASPTPQAAANAIYWAALDTVSYFGGLHWEHRDTIAVLNTTVPVGGLMFRQLLRGPEHDEIERAIRDLPPWIRQTLETDVVRQPVTLASSRRATVMTVTESELDTLFSNAAAADDPWHGWRLRYPSVHGWLAFSPAFVSDDGREATVYVELHCGPLCGSGVFVRLALEMGRWVALEAMPVWVS